MQSIPPLLLTHSEIDKVFTSLPEINEILSQIGARIIPLSLLDVDERTRDLLSRDTLSLDEAEEIKQCFLLSRERLLEVIQKSGREPHVTGGGELNTHAMPHGHSYPSLLVVEDGSDHSRFDHFYVNQANDGTGVDEVLQMVSGKGLLISNLLPDNATISCRLDCPSIEEGWLITYSGNEPHICGLGEAEVGTKLLVQAIGPHSWTMKYVE